MEGTSGPCSREDREQAAFVSNLVNASSKTGPEKATQENRFIQFSCSRDGGERAERKSH